jgi:hypothetical protein
MADGESCMPFPDPRASTGGHGLLTSSSSRLDFAGSVGTRLALWLFGGCSWLLALAIGVREQSEAFGGRLTQKSVAMGAE